MKPTIVPFVKWVGGKRQIMPELLKRVPKDYGTYFEPFLGGGALLFELQPSKAVVSDTNKELINAYRVIKNRRKTLVEYLLLMEYGHSEDFFQKIARIDREKGEDPHKLSFDNSPVLRAARLIYLNKASFNGIYRVNNRGFYNVPSAKTKTVKSFDDQNLVLIEKYLKESKISFSSNDFSKILDQVKPGDFVYFDPPYDYEEGSAGFDSYQKESFGRQGQHRLAEVCRKLDKMNVKFMASNHNTTFIKKEYAGFNISVISAKRLIGGKGAVRGDVQEVLITNYGEQQK